MNIRFFLDSPYAAFRGRNAGGSRLNAQNLTLEGRPAVLSLAAYVVEAGKGHFFSHPAVGFHFIGASTVIGKIETFSITRGSPTAPRWLYAQRASKRRHPVATRHAATAPVELRRHERLSRQGSGDQGWAVRSLDTGVAVAAWSGQTISLLPRGHPDAVGLYDSSALRAGCVPSAIRPPRRTPTEMFSLGHKTGQAASAVPPQPGWKAPMRRSSASAAGYPLRDGCTAAWEFRCPLEGLVLCLRRASRRSRRRSKAWVQSTHGIPFVAARQTCHHAGLCVRVTQRSIRTSRSISGWTGSGKYRQRRCQRLPRLPPLCLPP